jgi:hypothetical protein
MGYSRPFLSPGYVFLPKLNADSAASVKKNGTGVWIAYFLTEIELRGFSLGATHRAKPSFFGAI